MPGTQSLCRTAQPGRIPLRAVKAFHPSCEFPSPTISHAPVRDGSGSTISVSTKGWDILHQGAKTDIIGDYDFRNRVLSPTLGRWLSNDPIGFDAGDVNTYRYVGNGPGNGGNPLGLQQPQVKPVPPLTGSPPFTEKPVPGRSGLEIDISNPSLPWYFQLQNDKFKFGSQTGGSLPIGIPGLPTTWNLKTGTTGDFRNGAIYPSIDVGIFMPVIKRDLFGKIGIDLHYSPNIKNDLKPLPGQEGLHATFKLEFNKQIKK